MKRALQEGIKFTRYFKKEKLIKFYTRRELHEERALQEEKIHDTPKSREGEERCNVKKTLERDFLPESIAIFPRSCCNMKL
ncbi:1609_t:CDS:2 [Cetraspora pellucida]|uniref:1609_t:CDS:1 n=1 Tax=Cetraspora pellucida TaxID=1433469 RepID=A0A9N8W8K7_9GLOM|nr:1609_t:CDS:2 [Cetraspora pellucida]